MPVVFDERMNYKHKLIPRKDPEPTKRRRVTAEGLTSNRVERQGPTTPMSAEAPVEPEVVDDEVVILEETAPPPGRLAKVSRDLRVAQRAAKEAQAQAALVRAELDRVESSMSRAVFRGLKFLLDHSSCNMQLPVGRAALEQMVFSVLEQMKDEKLLDLTRSEYLDLSGRFNDIEKENQIVSKMFLDIHASLKHLHKEMQAESDALDKEGLNDDAPFLIDSDQEDVTITREVATESDVQPTYELPPMEQLRTQFANAVSKSMPTLLTSLQQNSVVGHAEVEEDVQEQQEESGSPFKWPELKVGDKVLGKKSNDVWYSGTIQEIIPQRANMEWQCRIKFDRKGLKLLSGKEVAYRDHIACFVRVGTRVVGLYKEEDVASSYYAGVISEAPSSKNNKRFLVFFDDGYAQYCDAKELHKVYKQNANVWEDIHPNTSAFIKEYLRIYPERPMVRLIKGQVVKTEWNGKWWTAKVQETDSSLVKMYFQADRRTEWIYRGSTRLEPLYKALANADAIKAAGTSRGRRHNLTMRPSDKQKKPSVEYTRNTEDEGATTSKSTTNPPVAQASKPMSRTEPPKKKSNVAKKSTGGGASASGGIASGGGGGGETAGEKWVPPWLQYQRKATPGSAASSITVAGTNTAAKRFTSQASSAARDIASVLQDRLASGQVIYDEEKATGERKETTIEVLKNRKPFKSHTCSPACVQDTDVEPETFKGRNILLIPLLCGWERQVCKARPATKRFVVYRAPCGRRVRSMEEVDQYLMVTDSCMLIDFFCFDHQLHVNTEFVPVKTFCDIKDMSYGKETYPISCVNGMDHLVPDPYLVYENHRIPSKGVHLNLDPDFLVCCDCTDNCRDKSKCACQQLTIENTTWIGEKDPDAGYKQKHLPEPLFTGIVECNSRCKCDKRCLNRVAQQGLQRRLQVFKTEKKGWGLRCLDDMAKGSFICIYAGQLLTDRGANEVGIQYGDEYLAELDFIEVVERQKEGYESDAEEFPEDEEEEDGYSPSKSSEEDSDFEPSDVRSRKSGRKKNGKSQNEKDTPRIAEKPDVKKKTEIDHSVKPTTSEPTTADTPISISDDEPEDNGEEEEEGKESGSKLSAPQESGPTSEEAASSEVSASQTEKRRPRAKKSTGGSRYNLSTSIKTCQEPASEKDEVEPKKECIPTRSFFQDDSDCYIMDARTMGNLGRYLNHSCSPNVFVQNIFVDTHDLRFPWVAFFAGQYIRAGTELTWDYNYEVDSVANTVLYCYCGSSTCRGRLL